MMGGGFGWWFLLLIPLFGIIVFAVLFTIFGRRWRRGMREGDRAGQADARSAQKTLAERLAQGDLDEVEYRARLEVLRANRADGQTPPASWVSFECACVDLPALT